MGDFFISIGAMSARQVETVLGMQRSGDTRSFGEIAFALGFVEDNSLRRFANYWTKTISSCHER
jgi:hypothetical protein